MPRRQALKTATRESPLLDEQQLWALIHLPDRRNRRCKRDAALLSLLALAGLRSHEASALKVEQLDEQPDGTVRILIAGKERTITVPRPGADFLMAWVEYTGSRFWVFPSRQGEPLTDKAVREIVKDYGASLGFSTERDADGVDRSLHPHSLRHSALTCLVRSSGDMYLTQRIAGHSDPRTTVKYYLKFSPRDADNAAGFISKALRQRNKRGRPRKGTLSRTRIQEIMREVKDDIEKKVREKKARSVAKGAA